MRSIAKKYSEIARSIGFQEGELLSIINYIKNMENLSLKKYVWKCVLGAEIAYAACVRGGFLPLRSVRGLELHHALFETIPGFNLD